MDTSASGVGTWAASCMGVPQLGQKRLSSGNSWPQFLQYLSAMTLPSNGSYDVMCLRVAPDQCYS